MKLLTIVPFCSKDSALAALTLDWTADLCGQQDRTVILAHEELVPSTDVQRAASRAFRTVEHLHVTASGDSWPLSANCYFAHIAAAMRGRAPWLLMEADCTFVHPQTLDRLDDDYQRAGKPCLGTIIPAYFYRKGVWTETGKMLAGVAVYHPNLWDHSPLLRALVRTQAAHAAARVMPKAFDCYLAPEILPISGSTSLIQHMGRSSQFRREGRNIVCSYGQESRWANVVAPESVLVHGCKDGSLIALLRAEMGIPVGKSKALPVAAVVIPAAPRRPAKSTDWGASDALPADPVPAAESRVVPAEVARGRHAEIVDKEAFATLADVKLAIQHWPDCKPRTFTLQGLRGRYRVVCQCGASSPKLPEGPNWEQAWSDQVAAPVENELLPASQVIEEHHLLREIDQTLRPASIDGGPGASEFDAMVSEMAKHTNAHFKAIDPQKELERISANPVIVNPKGGDDLSTKANASASSSLTPEKWESQNSDQTQPVPSTVASNGASVVQPDAAPTPIPIDQLRGKREIIAHYPELDGLIGKRFNQRVKQLRKKARDARAKPGVQALSASAGKILTPAARARKMELLEVGRGKQGAFLKLRRIAEAAGVKGTSALKKDPLIIAILEREFPNPYQEFSEAVA